MKLTGLHFEAFKAYAFRSEAKTSTANIFHLIESTPEFQALKKINDETKKRPDAQAAVA